MLDKNRINFIQVVISVLALIVAIIALGIAAFQLRGMNESLGITNEQLHIQINESEKSTKLLSQTLWENRKKDFDEHTFGAIYIWGNTSINRSNINEMNWTQNITFTFSNNFSYTALKDLQMHIEFRYGNYTYSCYPEFRINHIENNTLEPPFNSTTVEWKSIGASENATLNIKLNWSRNVYNFSYVKPSDFHIITDAKGDIYTIKELPIYLRKP